jgi:hypothetical protein
VGRYSFDVKLFHLLLSAGLPRRTVRSIKYEGLRHVIPLASNLRTILREFVEHYHAERNHQGLGNLIPFPTPTSVTGAIRRRERLGGLLTFYERTAA